MEKLRKQAEDKLSSLVSFLTHLPGKLEMIADEIDNENLSNAIGAIAQESTEYAHELLAWLKKLGIRPAISSNDNTGEELIEKSLLYSPRGEGKELLYICDNCETWISNLYACVLEEDFQDDSLKNMMNYQLLGIRSAFMRIRFLNTLRFNHN